ncbi:aminotransferase class V-fold PLP-dependent enzyme [Stenotrophobium rhamnosiphilum]|uniref:Aminotransferase n=1 Tax=Stenotrophobium rhamnosiphilum TaxID=2029166 RepID=A0A2T5MJD4_9GAMM|nr:aminotransferase class V-fold PLP-dependent enzyme [Stenotrophobium rhamnosiphilum]PTU32659.1 aminotransferase [Stenotrophobium rhamnosiphilum]
MSRNFPAVDPEGLQEYSVVFTDRSVNHMSKLFQQAMRDVSSMLKEVYNADAIAIVPGGGSFGMEAVARQFATGKNCLVIRNGWFSYRWSQIFDVGNIPALTTVLQAKAIASGEQQPFAPPAIEEVEETIRREKPDLVFAPHVETASGIILPDDYLKRVAAAVHEHGGLFILDCVASGAIWVDMKACGVDVLISAPQKGWSSTPCAALIMFSAAARQRLAETTSSSFAADLKKWQQIMQAFEDGGHAYHATMPTDGLLKLRDAMNETLAIGLEKVRDAQWTLGREVRAMLAKNGYPSVAAPGFESPGVVVSYTEDADISNAKKFIALGMQSAAGVPLMCGESVNFRTFRVGLFGLDKLKDVGAAVQRLTTVIEQLK